MKFQAQVREVKVREAASGDREVKIILVTEDAVAAQLMRYIAEEIVEISVSDA